MTGPANVVQALEVAQGLDRWARDQVRGHGLGDAEVWRKVAFITEDLVAAIEDLPNGDLP